MHNERHMFFYLTLQIICFQSDICLDSFIVKMGLEQFENLLMW